MSAGDAVGRMLTLVPWLLERPGASVAETAEAFGVSESTIRSDLGHLDFCGLPGLGGGALFDVTIEADRILVSMADELRRPLRLTPREALRLVLTVSAVEDALGDELPALRSAVEKVREAARLPSDTAVAVATGRSGHVPVLRQAIVDDRQVRLDYQGRTDPAPRWRTVDPWRLDVTADGWYLHGRDVEADGARVYRLDRLGDLEVTDVPRASAAPERLPTPHYEPTGPTVDVEVVLGPSARWLADTVTVTHDEEVVNGRRVVFATDALDWVARLLLMGGSDVEVVAPTALRTLVRDLAQQARARYA